MNDEIDRVPTGINRSSNVNPHHEYIGIVFSSAATYESRLVPILRTWGRNRSGFHLVIVSDHIPELANEKMVFSFPDTLGQAQRRWPLGLQSLIDVISQGTSELSSVNWIFVLDDDAFLNHVNVQRLLNSVDDQRQAIYVQLCHFDRFCGGAGWLAHVSILKRLASPLAAACNQGTEPYDVCFSRILPSANVELIQRGEFCSQPPSFYVPSDSHGLIRDKEDAGLRAGMDFPVTFHYIVGLYDEMQQRIDQGQPLWPW